MLKKIAKALDEMAKNEDLMAEILAAAEEEGSPDGQGANEIESNDKKVRLNTIGEGDEDKNLDTKIDPSKEVLFNKGAAQNNEGYDEDEFEEKEDDYEF